MIGGCVALLVGLTAFLRLIIVFIALSALSALFEVIPFVKGQNRLFPCVLGKFPARILHRIIHVVHLCDNAAALPFL